MENKKPGEIVKEYDVRAIERVSLAFTRLMEMGKIKNLFNFCQTHDIDRRNFERMRNQKLGSPSIYLLNVLRVNYGVSLDWLITGKGNWLV
ncbi:hypothetical protein [Pedobacter rhizosphaerae]|uniref:Bacteriophage CI repressor helix-turn-helix domain-containing protein n=1 Tax=Pedobacter rhizosphaerae TaxID=390241 RepID=A0A1H9TTK8_9SPHI|nr:hypothetical protein [Pedobacter rhizosphaerae]SES00337.1 hypothetical protein SAMN04488023_12476 [Pedobacter rhizosphaerae]